MAEWQLSVGLGTGEITMSKAYCHKHNIGPDDERWKVLMEELTLADEENGEPFKEQVCPQCFILLKERLIDAKRNLKVESREAVSLRMENDRLQKILDAVIFMVNELTGKDAVELSKQVYQKGAKGVPAGGNLLLEHGNLENILPNLIAEIASKGSIKQA
jgi:hypothetical protein